MLQSDVLVIGAGPTGLTVGAQLHRLGIDAAIVDFLPAGANTSRAAVVHARTLEALEPLCVSSQLTKIGIHVPLFTIRDRDRVLLPVDFSHLKTRYPYALMVSQADTERVLLSQLEHFGGRVRRPSRLIDLQQDADAVYAKLDDRTTIRARYVVGADGLHSIVREKAGIAFEGGEYEESFVLADARMTGDVPEAEVILYFSTEGMMVVAPLPGGVHRIVATVNSAPETPDASFMQALMDERGPKAHRAEIKELKWSSRFHIHHRVAKQFRSNRIFLAGDAAHVHSPAGGQGMNLGIQDAVFLGELLAAALQTGAQEGLDTYERERRPLAKEIVARTNRLTELATVPKLLRPIRNTMFATLAHLPHFEERMAMQLAGLRQL